MKAYATSVNRNEGSMVVLNGFIDHNGAITNVAFAVDHRMAAPILNALGSREKGVACDIEDYQIVGYR